MIGQALEARVEARGVSLKDVAAIDTTTEWVYGRSPTKQADTRAASGAFPEQRGAHRAASNFLTVQQCAAASHVYLWTRVCALFGSGDVRQQLGMFVVPFYPLTANHWALKLWLLVPGELWSASSLSTSSMH